LFKKKNQKPVKMSRSLGDLCYNIPEASIYGELTEGSILKLVSHLPQSEKTRIFDIGSGSGFTLCNFAKSLPTSSCSLFGIEITKSRVDLSRLIIPKIKPANVEKWEIIEGDICLLSTLPQVDICFSFDTTFTENLMNHIISLQLKSHQLQYVISSRSNAYYRPEEWLEIGRVATKSRGSGQVITFFVYQKIKK
jgi:SAM-dependent methyltransferase